jgi:hypothetical protein
MKIPLLFLAAFFIIATRAYPQIDIIHYKPPEVMKGSQLTIRAYSTLSQYNHSYGSGRDAGADLVGNLIKWRYSERLNYFSAFELPTSSGISYRKSANDTGTQGRLTLGVLAYGGINYYPVKDKFYLGFNGSTFNYFETHRQPLTSNYIGPNIGSGRILNASQIERTLNLERVLLEEKLLTSPLPYGTRKKLTMLFDRRNNQEFIYQFRDDHEIEFFSEIEKLLISEGVITRPLDARTVLKIYQSLTNEKFLYYPKYKGYQVQFMYLYPFGYYYGRKIEAPHELVFSGIYGLPVRNKTSFVFYGFVSKVVKEGVGYDGPFYYLSDKEYSSSIPERRFRNILQLSLPANASERYNPRLIDRDFSSWAYRPIKLYTGMSASVFHNFTPWLGMRGNLYGSHRWSDFSQGTYLYEEVIFDYAILSKLTLSAGIVSYQDYAGGKLDYNINAYGRLSYIIF